MYKITYLFVYALAITLLPSHASILNSNSICYSWLYKNVQFQNLEELLQEERPTLQLFDKELSLKELCKELITSYKNFPEIKVKTEVLRRAQHIIAGLEIFEQEKMRKCLPFAFYEYLAWYKSEVESFLHNDDYLDQHYSSIDFPSNRFLYPSAFMIIPLQTSKIATDLFIYANLTKGMGKYKGIMPIKSKIKQSILLLDAFLLLGYFELTFSLFRSQILYSRERSIRRNIFNIILSHLLENFISYANRFSFSFQKGKGYFDLGLRISSWIMPLLTRPWINLCYSSSYDTFRPTSFLLSILGRVISLMLNTGLYHHVAKIPNKVNQVQRDGKPFIQEVKKILSLIEESEKKHNKARVFLMNGRLGELCPKSWALGKNSIPQVISREIGQYTYPKSKTCYGKKEGDAEFSIWQRIMPRPKMPLFTLSVISTWFATLSGVCVKKFLSSSHS